MKRLKRFLIGMAAMVLCVMAPFSTYAVGRQLSEEDLFFYGMNGIYFYMPGNGETCFGTLMGSTVYEKVLSGLLGMGLNEVAAAGVYSNMMAEGFGSGGLLTHEYGVDSFDDIGGYYAAATAYGPNGLLVKTEDVRDLYNIDIMHGIGPNGWSYGLRVYLLEVLREYDVEKYATEWDETTGRYVYSGWSYDQMVERLGEGEADKVLTAVLNYFYRLYIKNEFAGRDFTSAGKLGSFIVTQDDINAQGLAKYGITAGMTLDEALNLVETPYEASELFFTTGEMPGMTQYNERQSVHADRADEGLELIRSAGLTASGATNGNCGGNGSIVDTAMELAWEGFNSHSLDDPKPEYVAAMKETGTWDAALAINLPVMGASCDQFVSTVMRYSGVDPNFPAFWPPTQERYMADHPDMYEKVEANRDYENLQPGDVFVVGYQCGTNPDGSAKWCNHIYLFIGMIDGKPWQASASYNNRTGEYFDWITWEDYDKEYSIYRRI